GPCGPASSSSPRGPSRPRSGSARRGRRRRRASLRRRACGTFYGAESPLILKGMPSVRYAMDDVPLSPMEAASAIGEVGSWSDQLRQRTTGLTWMFWGIVTPAIFVTYALAASTLAPTDAPWWGLLWLPWAALGLLFTALLWRSSRVAMSRPALSAREFVVPAALFLLATVGSVVLVVSAKLPLYPPTAVLVGIGLLAGMLGVREAFGEAREVGVFQALAGIALIL